MDKKLAASKLPRIQILRFIAATSVVIFHALGTSSEYITGSTIFSLFRFGDYGVDLFFVISGFVIFHSTNAKHYSWKEFLKHRIVRIVPLYWFVTIVTAVLFAVPGLSRSIAPDFDYLVQSLFYLSWTSERMPVVYPGWSLEYEMFFYLAFMAMIAIRNVPWRAVSLLICALVGAGAVMNIAGIHPPVITFFTDPIMLEFVMGILIARLFSGGRLPPLVIAILLLDLLLLFAGPTNERVVRIFVAGIPSALIIYGAALLDRAKPMKNPNSNPIVVLGDASYSIYLVQAIVISAFVKLVLALFGEITLNLMISGATFATLLVALAVHHFVDLPMRRGCATLIRQKRYSTI